ncbi:MAG TPA: protein kinase [Polyangia bacterium]|nr:protein kinase [Polyangia bacterium]
MQSEGGALTYPSQFGRYALLERLAVGGMAEVFRAKISSSHGFEKILVIKRILPHLAADATFVSMFIDEAKLTAQLTHPKIVQILDFGDVGGQYFIALEYVDGSDALGLLRTCAQRRLHIPRHLALFIINEVLEALDYAHNARDMDGKLMHIVHRDISPSNIFLSKRGDVKLGDFGIAHAQRRESKTQAGTLKGKYGYMSPEQVVGQPVDGRSDLFALGVVLAEMLMGRRLFTAPNDLDVLLMVRDARIERLGKYCRDLPPALDRIVRRALHKDPGERFPTAASFRDALGDYLYESGQRVSAPDLRAFLGDLLDGGPEANERLAQQARKLADADAKAAPVAPRRSSRSGIGVAPSTAPGDAAVRAPLEVMTTERTSDQPSDRPSGPKSEPTSADAPGLGALVAAGLEDAASEVLVDADPLLGVQTRETAPGAAGLMEQPTAQVAQALTAVEGELPVDDGWPADEENERSSVRGFTPAAQSARLPKMPSNAMPTGPHPGVGRFISGAPNRPPDSAGDISVITPMRLFCDLAAGETGLLRFEVPGTVKEIFLVGGAPESVNSSLPSERFGEYLVTKEILGRGDLELALGMLPHYNGKLGDTLVALGLLRPLDVFRLLSQQVRDRVIEVFGWTEGTFAFFRGTTNPSDSFPLGLDTFEILGAGVVNLPGEQLEQRFASQEDFRPVATHTERVQPEAFRIGPTPREVLELLDGERPLRAWMDHFSEPEERLTFLRSLYLLVETDLAQLD